MRRGEAMHWRGWEGGGHGEKRGEHEDEVLTPVVRQPGHHPSDPATAVYEGLRCLVKVVTILRDTVPVRHDPQVYSSRHCVQFHTYHQYDVTPVPHTRHEQTNFPASKIIFRTKVFDILYKVLVKKFLPLD